MRDLEHKQYDEYGPRAPEQAPQPEETQKTHEYQTQTEQSTYAEHGVDTPVATKQEPKKTAKPKPPVSRLAMQFTAISTAAVVTVTAGAVLSDGAFLPELGAWAKESVEQISAMETVNTRQPAVEVQAAALAWMGESPSDNPPADASGEAPSPGTNLPEPGVSPPPSVQTLKEVPLPQSVVEPTPVSPEKPVVPGKPTVKPIVKPPVEPPKPLVPPVEPPKPLVPPVEPPKPPVLPVDPPYEPDPPSHTHGYTASTQAATCGAAGQTTYTCSCGASYTEPIPATGAHTYVTAVVAPTCVAGGYTSHICSTCHDAQPQTDVLPPLGHTYVTAVVAPTCVAGGYTSHICSTCHDAQAQTDVLPPLGHTYVTAVVAPTCVAGGYTSHICSTCHDAQAQTDVLPPLGHTYVTAVVAPTCVAGGYTSHICSTCHDAQAQTDVLPPLGHTYGAWTDTKDGATHKHTCPACSAEETAAHSPWAVPDDVCTACNAKKPPTATLTVFVPFNETVLQGTYTTTYKIDWVGTPGVLSATYTINGGAPEAAESAEPLTVTFSAAADTTNIVVITLFSDAVKITEVTVTLTIDPDGSVVP